MSTSKSKRFVKAEKPVEENISAQRESQSGSTSGWGVRSARPLVVQNEDKENSDSDKSSLDDARSSRNHSEAGSSRHAVKVIKEKESELPQSLEKSSKSTTKKVSLEKKNVKKKFISVPSPQDLSEELENLEFINFKNLPKLPRIDSDLKGHFHGSNHKFERPISGFYIRVRLLKYPAFAEKAQWPGDLLVLDDRIFAWQEKVFSKWEKEKYSDKKKLRTDLDHSYHNELQNNPNSTGVYLHSYVDSDYFVAAQERRALVKRCAAFHLKRPQKHPELSSELKSFNSDGESVYELDSDTEDRTTKVQGSFSRQSLSRKPLSDEEERKLAEKLEKDKARRQKVEEELEAKRQIETQKKEDKKRQEMLKLSKKQIESEERIYKLEDLERKEQEAKDKMLQKHLKSKKPSVAISAALLSTYSSPSLSPLREKRMKAKSRKGSKAIIDSDENSNKNEKSSEKNIEGSRSKIISPPDGKKERRKKVEDDDDDDNGEYEELVKVRKQTVKKSSLTKPTFTTLKTSRPVWRLPKHRFIERSVQPLPQCMYIMATLPHFKRRKREIPVCVIKAYQKSGIVVLKPPFGYRIIEAKRNHIYRLSWELHHSSNLYDQSPELSKRTKQNIEWSERPRALSTESESKTTLDEMAALFELVPMNEMRVVVMGEIVSAERFNAEPICVHYLVEIPKGWKNDSLSSNLQGTTNNSFTTNDCIAHFSHEFFFQLAFSMDSVEFEDRYLRPMILLMVVSMDGSGRMLYEGYGYISIPSTPGSHIINVQTWKPKPRSIVEKMQSVFLGVSPSLQDIHAVHIPVLEQEDPKLANRLGLHTEPSGSVKVRLNVIHQTPSCYRDQESKLDLLEKMSSATILKSVQAVIEAFHRARKRAMLIKSH